MILGPPASGKTTIAMWLCKHLKSVLLCLENLMTKKYSSLAERARKHYQKMKSLPSSLLVKLIEERLGEDDCVQRGWILDGIPETREQVLMIQALGITPRHVIVLSAPDTVLIERNLGKRVDPHTGEIYHTTFDWPPEFEIQNRLIVPEGISEQETAQKLMAYHRNIVSVLPSYPKILKVISADQPCVDVFYQALTYAQTNHRSNAPFTLRVLLLGPKGSGKRLQAALLAQKYGLVSVCCGRLLKEAVADKSKFGEVIQPFFEKDLAVPDGIIMKVLSNRLTQHDCIQKGWVMYGFPRDLDQAHMLNTLEYKPNSRKIPLCARRLASPFEFIRPVTLGPKLMANGTVAALPAAVRDPVKTDRWPFAGRAQGGWHLRPAPVQMPPFSAGDFGTRQRALQFSTLLRGINKALNR
ncbi:adenylate kinase 8 isoform X2 [Pteropus alecto]|uniref:adenylate kinase 8 isoform X2 n=1 Tax=Pteropus alecto TaxID=9402 RepID=UPI0007688A39|nr:adenylate kinase 8 isoform X2 [Pteropus alecto]